MRYQRTGAIFLAILAAPSCTMSDAMYRQLVGRTGTLVKNEAHRPPLGQYAVVPFIEYDCNRSRNPPSMPEVMMDHRKLCPDTAHVSQYECVDHSGRIVRFDHCEDSHATVVKSNIPFPYDTAGTAARAAFDERIAAPFRQPQATAR